MLFMILKVKLNVVKKANLKIIFLFISLEIILFLKANLQTT